MQRDTTPTHQLMALLALVLWPALGSSAEPAKPAVNPVLSAFLSSHCVGCHDSTTKKGGLDLEALSADLKDPSAFDRWVRVHDRIRAGEMPPKARTRRPAPAETEKVLTILNTDLSRVEQARRAGDGRAVFRRLNRTEYENTLRDLFGLSGLKIKERLPEDGQAFGFDKSAAGLELSYVQLAKYLEASDVALDAAIAPHAARPAQFKVHIPGSGCQTLFAHAFTGHTVFLKDFKYDDSRLPIPTGRIIKDAEANKLKKANQKNPREGTMGILVPEGVGEFKPRFPFHVVEAGRYKVRMSVWSFVWDKGQIKPSPRTEAATLSAEGRTLGYFDAPSLKPTVTEIEVWLNTMSSPKDHLLFNAASLWPAGPRNGNVANYTGPGIALDWLEIEGPLLDQWPTVAHRRLFGDLPLVALPATSRAKGRAKGRVTEPAGGDFHKPRRPADNAYMITGHGKPFIQNLASLPQRFELSTVSSKTPEVDARRLLADFLPRAFRRPVAPEEVSRYVGLFQARFAAGDVFEVAMRTAYQAALCSPDFLFLKEKSGPLDQWAMASRLSYFLWNSMPDEQLFALAEKGKLHDPAVLHEQVERMLKDPRAERFIVDFTDQWLELEGHRRNHSRQEAVSRVPQDPARFHAGRAEGVLPGTAGKRPRRYQRDSLGLRHAQPAPGRPLPHSWRRRLGPAAGATAGGLRPGRFPDPGGGAEGDRQRHGHLAGAARDVGAEQDHRPAARTAAAQCAGHRARRPRHHDCPRDACQAPEQPVLRRLPRQDRPARLRPGELRRHRRPADALPLVERRGRNGGQIADLLGPASPLYLGPEGGPKPASWPTDGPSRTLRNSRSCCSKIRGPSPATWSGSWLSTPPAPRLGSPTALPWRRCWTGRPIAAME